MLQGKRGVQHCLSVWSQADDFDVLASSLNLDHALSDSVPLASMLAADGADTDNAVLDFAAVCLDADLDLSSF